jgi:cell division protease FtsH
MLFGGRIAEKIVFNEFTTGAGNDIERASNLSRKMVCEWGMSERMGPLAYGAKEEELFLGREITKHRDYSEDTGKAIDEEVKKIITSAEKRAEDILRENIDKLHLLSTALLEREILDSEEIDKILRGETLPPLVKNGNGTAVSNSSTTIAAPQTSAETISAAAVVENGEDEKTEKPKKVRTSSSSRGRKTKTTV